jgi:C4-dicarboxylate-specific signal transduction histidine kinase
MRKFWAQPLRRQLLIAIVLLLGPVLVAAVWAGIATLRDRQDDLRTQSRELALTTAAWVNRDLEIIDRMATSIGGIGFLQQMNPELSADLFRRAVATRPNWLDILLVRADGTLVAHGATAPLTLDPGTLWADRVISENRRVIIPIDAARRAPQHLVIGYPVRDGSGKAVGALGYLINLQSLQDALASLPLPAGSVVSVSDQSTRILARTVDPEHTIGQVLHPGQHGFEAKETLQQRAGLDGVDRMYAEVVADQGPWLVSVGLPMSVALDKAMSLWLRSVTVLLVGLAGWLIVAVVLSRKLSDAVSHLDATAKRIAKGDFSPMTRRPMLSREFADLQVAFDAMLQRFNQTRNVLDSQMTEERRIREELESLQGQVIRQERLAAVGQLVSGVAHEINNPLQAILGFAELLQMQSDVPDSVKSDLRLIQKESARACGIIRNLAMFARQQPGEAAPVRLVDVITSVAELRQRRLQSEDIELRIDDHSGQPVMAVVTELQQVVLNFVVNAEQAIMASGRLPGRITVRSYDRDDRVLLEVEDTGPGIPPENEAKLFQPFFTTKPVGQGTGLGLSVSYGIVDSLGGHIGYRRAPAGGAIFYFDLPAAAAVRHA